MEKAKVKYAKCGNLITMKANIAEKLEDFNSEALASAGYGLRLLKSLESILEIIDSRDGKLDNEPIIVKGKELCSEAKNHFNNCFSYDKQEMLIWNNVIEMFPEHINQSA